MTITLETMINSTEASVITTIQSDCVILEYEDFIPWNNPDNIVRAETEDFMRFLKDIVFLPILCLIGCAGNIINMIVFYKQGLKERINVCLFALSLADGLYMLSNMISFGEQLQLQFTTKEKYGIVNRFVANNHVSVIHGFIWVSQVLSAIIASERCFCILQPLRSKTVLSTSTMTAIIIAVNVVILGLTFIIMTRFTIACTYDPFIESVVWSIVPGEFYYRHPNLVIYLDVVVFGAGLPGLVVIVVTTTTIITMRKLRQAAEWRAGTSSSSGVSQRELALTKMLVANSVFFIVCSIPFVVFRLVFLCMPEVNNGGRQQNFFLMVQWLLIIVSYFNSSFNIVVYYTMGTRYRQIFWQLFSCCTKSNNSLNCPQSVKK